MDQPLDLNFGEHPAGYLVPALPGAVRLSWSIGWRWFLASLASVAVFALSIWAITELLDLGSYGSGGPLFWLVVLGGTGLGGAVAGGLQWLAMRGFLPLGMPRWPLATGAGVALGMRVATWAVEDLDLGRSLRLFGYPYDHWLRDAIPFAVLGLCMGAAQWLALRRLRHGWIWALAMMLAVAVSGAMTENFDPAPWMIPASFAAYTLICTAGMVALLRAQRTWEGRG